MRPSIVGFKDPKADLHRKSSKIFLISLTVSIIFVAVTVNITFSTAKKIEAKVKKPPVIIQMENIPETRHVVRAPAPRLGAPLEVEDEFMPDDITIESTSLDLNEDVAPPPPPAPVADEEPVVEDVEEEIFEFFAVEEQPQRTKEVAPEYPEAAKQAGIDGIVIVRALVDKTGRVTEVQVLKGPEQLQQAAIDAALKTGFTPAKQNDMPVSCWVQIPFRFVLE